MPVDDSAALATALIETLGDDAGRRRYVEVASRAVRKYDWSVVARDILRVYETVAGAGAKVRVEGTPTAKPAVAVRRPRSKAKRSARMSGPGADREAAGEIA